MTVETGEIRRRLKRVVEEAKRAASARRSQAEASAIDGDRVLRMVLAPMFRKMAAVLKAEGHLFTVSTPKAGVQLAAKGPGENRIELVLDTAADPPALVSRVCRTKGRRVLVDEKALRTGDAIGSMTEEDALEYLLAELPPFVEK